MSLYVCVMGNTDKKERAKAARCGECKNCLNLKSKRKCTNPQQGQQAAATSAAFSSPVTRRQSDAGRGSGVVVSSSVDVDSQWTPASKDSTPTVLLSTQIQKLCDLPCCLACLLVCILSAYLAVSSPGVD